MNIVTQTVSPLVGLCFVFSGYVGMMSVIVGCKCWEVKICLFAATCVFFFVCACPFFVACHRFLLCSKDLPEPGMFTAFLLHSGFSGLPIEISSFLTVAKSLSLFPVSRAAYRVVLSSAVLLKRNHLLEPHV